MNFIQKSLLLIASPFYGKGYVDKYCPFLIRVFKRVYSSSGDNPEVEVSIPNGLKMVVKSDDIGVGLPLVSEGEYEPMQSRLFLDSVKDGMCVLDIGANVGYYSLLASSKVGSSGKVFSFEPDVNNIDLLSKNIEFNSVKNVEVVEKAVSNNDGVVEFMSSDFSKGDSSIANAKSSNTVSVESVTLDSFVSASGIVPDVIKVDVEGAEVMVLEGGKEFLSSNSRSVCLFVEYNPESLLEVSGVSGDELISMIMGYGFNIAYIVDERASGLIEYSGDKLEEIMHSATFCNLVAYKNKDL